MPYKAMALKLSITMTGSMPFYFHCTQSLCVRIHITPNLSLFTLLENPSSNVGDLKCPFEVAGMFGAGAFSVHVIILFPSLLIVAREKNK